jgi:hypothetical protein
VREGVLLYSTNSPEDPCLERRVDHCVIFRAVKELKRHPLQPGSEQNERLMIAMLVSDLLTARRANRVNDLFLEMHLGLTPALRMELFTLWDRQRKSRHFGTDVQSNHGFAIMLGLISSEPPVRPPSQVPLRLLQASSVLGQMGGR